MDKTIWWEQTTHSIHYIDETVLPGKLLISECCHPDELIEAIKRLAIRGAPALGVAGGFGVALVASRSNCTELQLILEDIGEWAEKIKTARPTAVNLSWGVSRVMNALTPARSPDEVRFLAVEEAVKIAAEDADICHRIGDVGFDLIPDGCSVLTHCNAGGLACSEWGTALGVIRTAHKNGKWISVYACETRPLLQGARLTAWELDRDDIDVTVITDSTAAYLMRQGKIDLVIVGADRITNDAVFNKIGTYMHAVCAHYHKIPFYVAAPVSTFDFLNNENSITIEERSRDELAYCGEHLVVPDCVKVKNYAFDATPLSLISAIITEKGILKPPYDISKLKETDVIC